MFLKYYELSEAILFDLWYGNTYDIFHATKVSSATLRNVYLMIPLMMVDPNILYDIMPYLFTLNFNPTFSSFKVMLKLKKEKQAILK